jgi:hypothetical protein
MPSWEPQSRLYRGPASFRGGQDLSMHPREFYLPLPRGAPNPAHVVGSGAAPRATGGGGGVARQRRLYTVGRGYP